jgi:hypothetical protein
VNDVVYLYGFVPRGTPAPPAALRGIADAAVALLEAGDVSAVVSHLPAADWSGYVVEARLQDLQWVGEQGLAHERVVLWFVDHGEILPARLFSLHSDVSALRASAAGSAMLMARQLGRLAGRREWNLKVGCDADVLGANASLVSEELRRLDDELQAAAPGRRYLLQRRRADLLAREVRRAARRLAGALLDELRPHAEAVQVLPLPQEAEAGAVVLNAALLVPRAAEPALREAAATRIEELSRLGMLASLTGPWAAYRFVELDDAG